MARPAQLRARLVGTIQENPARVAARSLFFLVQTWRPWESWRNYFCAFELPAAISACTRNFSAPTCYTVQDENERIAPLRRDTRRCGPVCSIGGRTGPRRQVGAPFSGAEPPLAEFVRAGAGQAPCGA